MSNELEERNMKKEAQIIALANQKGALGRQPHAMYWLMGWQIRVARY